MGTFRFCVCLVEGTNVLQTPQLRWVPRFQCPAIGYTITTTMDQRTWDKNTSRWGYVRGTGQRRRCVFSASRLAVRPIKASTLVFSMTTVSVTSDMDFPCIGTERRYRETRINAGDLCFDRRILQLKSAIATSPIYFDSFKDHGKLNRADRTLPILTMEASRLQALVPNGALPGNLWVIPCVR